MCCAGLRAASTAAASVSLSATSAAPLLLSSIPRHSSQLTLLSRDQRPGKSISHHQWPIHAGGTRPSRSWLGPKFSRPPNCGQAPKLSRTLDTLPRDFKAKHTRLTAIYPGLPRWAGTKKVKPIWILLKQETVSGSGISWAICKSASCSRQTTTPAPHHYVFLQAGCPSCRPTNSVKALKATRQWQRTQIKNKTKTQTNVEPSITAKASTKLAPYVVAFPTLLHWHWIHSAKGNDRRCPFQPWLTTTRQNKAYLFKQKGNTVTKCCKQFIYKYISHRFSWPTFYNEHKKNHYN